jgi:hypothetical protein
LIRSEVGAVCILARALRLDGFFFVLLPDVLDFTGVTVLCACEVLADFVAAVDFAAAEPVELDFFVVDCAAARKGVDKIHKPLASNNPPAARRIILFVFLNAPR